MVVVGRDHEGTGGDGNWEWVDRNIICMYESLKKL